MEYMSSAHAVKSASRDDVPDIMRLMSVLHRGDIGSHMEEIVQEFISDETHLVIVAVINKSVQGLLIGSYRLDIDFECRCGLIDAIVVDEAVRNEGIGKRLFNEFVRWARSHGCTMLQVVNPNRKFFAKLGFKDRNVVFQQVSINPVAT